MHRRNRTLLNMFGLVAIGVAFYALPAPALIQQASTPAATECGPDDRPETGLQGQVPVPDRLSGRAAEGYNCNLEVIGRFESTSFANFDSYENCVYYTDNRGGSGMAEGGGMVVDVSDPTNPVQTDYLTAVAMRNGGESLRVNQARGLLVTNHYNSAQTNPGFPEYVRSLAVYDVSQDCRHPQLLADVIMPTAEGHEGCFQPDGMAYYMASLSTITPIDLTDPRNPTQMSEPWPLTIHGCSISDDGNRGYFGQIAIGDPQNAAMLIVDTSEVQARTPDAQPHIVGSYPTPDNQIQQSTYPLLYDGRPYLFDWSEATGIGAVRCPQSGSANFGYAHMLDIADEANPVEVSRLTLEVHDPANCTAVAADQSTQTAGVQQGDVFWQGGSGLFLYDFHYCRPDRLHDPTIMACANFGSGLRVFDIRDAAAPAEIAYYNTGTVNAGEPVLDFAVSPPVIRRDLGQIWWVTLYGGLHIAEFREGVWPFEGDDPCPSPDDYFAAQYDLGFDECVARQHPQTIARVAGPDRIATAAAVSAATVDRADTVVVARADAFPDALSGAPLAVQLGAPLLLSQPDALSQDTATEIARLGASHAVILGGEAALSSAVVEELESSGMTVERVGGADRYATSIAVAQRLGDTSEAFVASGEMFPDALSASGLAAAMGQPILLTPHDRLADGLEDILSQDVDVVVVGGEAAVTPDVFGAIDASAAGVSRLSGATRYGTSRAVADEALRRGVGPSPLWLATGEDFADALVAGTAAGSDGGVLLLVHGRDPNGSPDALDFLVQYAGAISSVRIAGGTAAVTTAVEAALQQTLDDGNT